jgi:hypothetical protein
MGGRCRLATALIAVAIGITACGPGEVSPTPSGSTVSLEPRPAIACSGLDEPDCSQAGLAVLARFAGGPSVLSILITAWSGCDGPCPETLAARPEGSATVEVVGGLASPGWQFHPPGSIEVDQPSVAASGATAPTSDPTDRSEVPYRLAHCGLLSGIDVDGSWWDPVGPIPDHPATSNSADGVVSFTGPDSAVFQTPDGFSIALVRHPGSKHFHPCM